jgi:hypothetical protein
MGWMAWEQLHCESGKVCEATFVDVINHLDADGWVDLGYEYLSIDDCWMGPGRDSNGEVYADTTKFPHGMPWLVDYAHQHRVKLGIYLDYGSKTCAGYEGSQGYLRRDAHTIAKWKVDMVKVDGCYSEGLDKGDGFPAMTYFLNETGRPILYLSEWPFYVPNVDYSLLPPHMNSWRCWTDIGGNWPSVLSVINMWGEHPQWAQWAGPGGWNDPDQIVIGIKNYWSSGINQPESRSQMSIWAVIAAPLMMSNDIAHLEQWAIDILKNKEVIAVNQDKLGKQGIRLTPKGEAIQIWSRPLANGDLAVALLNAGDSPASVTLKFEVLGQAQRYEIRDLWAKKDLGTFTNKFDAGSVGQHDTVFLRMKPVN